MSRPKLAVVPFDAEEYIDYWGAELYKEFCVALGLAPLGYWAWEEQTRERGVDWWHGDLELDDIKHFPDMQDYRMYVRTAHPHEADGPSRLKYYVVKRAHGMQPEQVHDMLWNELGGKSDRPWYEMALQYIQM